jgi:hypothetical protein
MNTDTFEDVDAHVTDVNLARLIAHGKVSASADVKTRHAQVCEAFHAVRPILAAVAAIPFFPPRWRAVVTAFMAVLDGVCPR